MTLEIYYRYMPIYSQKSAEDSWDDASPASKKDAGPAPKKDG
jgi:hypothetical protein